MLLKLSLWGIGTVALVVVGAGGWLCFAAELAGHQRTQQALRDARRALAKREFDTAFKQSLWSSLPPVRLGES